MKVWFWIAVAAVALSVGASDAVASQPFAPTLDVSLTNTNPSAVSNVVTVTSLPSGSHAISNFSMNFPPGWGIAGDTDVPFGDSVAEATMSVDVDCNSSVENFGFFLTNSPADPEAVAEWTGQINSWWLLTLHVDGSASLGYDLSADMTNFSEFHQLCAPQSLAVTIYGRSLPNKRPVATNPANSGDYVFTVPLVSLGGEHVSEGSDTVCICPTLDDDADGVVDETPCGSDPNDPTSRPERIDPPFAGIDDDGDTLIDEPLPPGAENYDCDGDGYTGLAENHIYAPNTRGDQDACGANSRPPQSPAVPIGWPADLKGGAFSADRINIEDVASFKTPVNRMDTDPGDPGYDVRWDVVPGSTFGKAINIQDLASVDVVAPPMLGFKKAYGGPFCPWLSSDIDGDGVIDEAGCGSDPANPSSRPERIDGVFAGVDDDGDTLVDETLPEHSGIYDCDGDGYRGFAEDHIFAPSLQGKQDACGLSGWPADLAGGTFSGNKVNIQDLATFITPVRRINTSPGDAAYASRWDMVPGSTFGKAINVQDMANISALFPPMLGIRAFNGPQCPWEP
jgi:hypothetical protein